MSNEPKNDMTGKIGIVTALDTAAGKVRVRLPDHDDLESYWLPVLMGKTHKDKEYWMPDPGEHVICLVDENAEFGVVLGAIYSDADTPPVDSKDKRHVRFDDATWVEYDRSTGVLTVDCVNRVDVKTATVAHIQAGQLATIQAPVIILDGEVTITKNLQVDLSIHANINIIAGASVAAQNGGVTLESHKHGGVVSGGALTGTPTG